MFAGRCFLRGRWASLYPTLAAVVANVVDCPIDDRLVVNVVNVHHINIRHRPVVEETSSIPPSADKTGAEITEAVVNSAIEAYLRSPPTFMEEEDAAIPT